MTAKKGEIILLPVVISYEEDTYLARCPLLQGAFAEGDTPEEALKELLEVVHLIISYKKERGEHLLFATSEWDKSICTAVPMLVNE